MDWGAGSYERTAATLEEAGRRAVDALDVEHGMRVLDLGSGTGNAALEAARRGATVTAVDPAKRLVDVSLARAAREGLTLTATVGDASNIPCADVSFDALISVFAVIFAPDAERAVSEMLRVVRPGGRIVITSWVPEGPISQAGMILREAAACIDPSARSRPSPAWGDPRFVRALLEPHGASVQLADEALVFEADSPAAWFEEQEQHHPIWRGIREALASAPGIWEGVRARTLAALHAGNETTGRLRVTSRYLVIKAVRAG